MANEITLPEVLGPAMTALNERQRAFVVAALDYPHYSLKQLAAAAGYTGSDNTLSVTGHRLMHNSLMLDAMHEVAEERLRGGAVMAVSVLLDIAKTAPENKDKLKAIGMVLDRVGLHAKSEHKVVTQDVSKTDAAMIERIEQLAKELGLDPKALLGSRAQKELPAPIDAEFTEVETEDWSAL